MLRTGALALLSMPLLLSCQGPLDLEDLLDRNAEARGGREAVQSLNSVRIELHLIESGFAADLLYYARRPDYARVDVSIDGQVVFTEAVNDSGAWQQNGPAADPVASSPEGTMALRRGAIGNLYGLHELPLLGYRLSLLEAQEIDGIRFYPIEVVGPDGTKGYEFIDPTTFLVTRKRGARALHPDLDSTVQQIESQYSRFQDTHGLVRAWLTENRDLRTGQRIQSTEVKRIELNPPLDLSLFQRPQRP